MTQSPSLTAFWKRASLDASLLVASLLAPLPASAGALYGLVVGIDTYDHLNDLSGAVNDAKDVSGTLETLGAEKIILLTDGEATRESIFASWQLLTARAREGDTLVFHYAGHGARQEAIVPGHEDMDNMFLLAGFAESGVGVNERIVDNEIGHMLAEEKEATVVFVADSCFAGGMTRDLAPGTEVSLRVADVRIDPAQDRVADRVKSLGEVDEASLEHVIWVYAQDRNKVTQEIRIDDQSRGALSYAFSRALEGNADRDGDRVLNTAELKSFVNRSVTRHTERRQRPEVNAGSRDLEIDLNETAGTAPAVFELPVLSVFAGASMALPNLTGIRPAGHREDADLIVDGETGALLYKTGDKVADLPKELTTKVLQPVVDKWRFIQFLSGITSTENPMLNLSKGSRTYYEGERVTFSIQSPSQENVVLFNLASSGEIQLVGPVRKGGSGLASGRLRAGRTEKFRSEVIAPFGADHLIAITTGRFEPGLVDAVKTAESTGDLAALAQDFGDVLKGQSFGLDWVGLYSRKGEQP